MSWTRAYAILLGLYPGRHQAVFSAEMLATFEEAVRAHRESGWSVRVRFAFGELFGLLAGAAKAWTDTSLEAVTIDLTRMRPPGVGREAYVEALDEVIQAQRLVQSNLAHMQQAIYRQEFALARFYSDEDRKARENLRRIRRKYGIAE